MHYISMPYHPRKRRGVSTRTNTSMGLEHLREVWCAASSIQASKKRITIRGVQRISNISSSSIVASCFRILIDCGYMKRGPFGESSTWQVVIPMHTYGEKE